ncbi:MAG: transposase [Bacteroidia bacterium]|nr:transposase [Bacteroidia bacterium]
MPAGGLSEDRMEWVASPDKFFLSVKVLSRIFRGIFCKNLAEVINKGNIILPRFEGLNGMEIYQEIISVHF